MDKKRIQHLQRRKQVLEKRMGLLTPLMRGSVVELSTTCGHPNCHCARGDKHKKVYLSVSANGKTRLVYLGKERAPIAARYTAHYKTLVQILDEMTLINMELLKANVLE